MEMSHLTLVSYRDHSSWQDTAFCLTSDDNVPPGSSLWINKPKQRYFNLYFMNYDMSSGSLQATFTPCPPPVLNTGSVPQGLLWMRGSWINMEALTPVSLLQRASHQRQRSRWKNLRSLYDIQLPGGSDMVPHRETGGEVWETSVSVRFDCLSLFGQFPLSALSLMMYNTINWFLVKAQRCCLC